MIEKQSKERGAKKVKEVEERKKKPEKSLLGVKRACEHGPAKSCELCHHSRCDHEFKTSCQYCRVNRKMLFGRKVSTSPPKIGGSGVGGAADIIEDLLPAEKKPRIDHKT